MQIEFEFDKTQEKKPTLADVKIGDCFRVSEGIAGFHPVIYMRIAPVKFLVHSTMVHEVLTRGDCFVLNMASGMFTIMKFNTIVMPLFTKLQITGTTK